MLDLNNISYSKMLSISLPLLKKNRRTCCVWYSYSHFHTSLHFQNSFFFIPFKKSHEDENILLTFGVAASFRFSTFNLRIPFFSFKYFLQEKRSNRFLWFLNNTCFILSNNNILIILFWNSNYETYKKSKV